MSYDQYKLVAEAAEGTPARAVVLKLLGRAYSNRRQVYKVYDTTDSARRAAAVLQAHGITVTVYERYWGGNWMEFSV
jgi:hypothetical protein